MKILKLFNHQHHFPTQHHTFVGSYMISRRIAKLTRTDIMRTLSLSLSLFIGQLRTCANLLYSTKNSRNNPDRQPKVVGKKGTAAAGSGEIAVRNLLTKAELVFILLYYIYICKRGGTFSSVLFPGVSKRLRALVWRWRGIGRRRWNVLVFLLARIHSVKQETLRDHWRNLRHLYDLAKRKQKKKINIDWILLKRIRRWCNSMYNRIAKKKSDTRMARKEGEEERSINPCIMHFMYLHCKMNGNETPLSLSFSCSRNICFI